MNDRYLDTFWVGFSNHVPTQALLEGLDSLFPGLRFGDLHEYLDRKIRDDDVDVFLSVDSEQGKEFRFFVNFWFFPRECCDEIVAGLGIAAFFSRRLGVRTICDGYGFGAYESPCWDIVWQDGVAYLANDSADTQFDGGDEPVRIVGAIDLSESMADFDRMRQRMIAGK
jgi:hypothetical protein